MAGEAPNGTALLLVQAAFLASFTERAKALHAEADAQKTAHKEVRRVISGLGRSQMCSHAYRRLGVAEVGCLGCFFGTRCVLMSCARAAV